MVKKIIGWTIVAVLAIVLIVGAVNRTIAKTGESSYAQVGRGEGRSGAQGESYSAESNARQVGQGRGQGGNGVYDNITEDSSIDKLEAVEWFTLDSEVVDVGEQALLVTFGDRQTMDITGRAWSFAREMGLLAQPGDQLRVTGFYESEDHLEVSQMENLTSGAMVTLRDENGRPMWAGWRRNGS